MSRLTDQDWEDINAYHDGELAPNAARALEVRLKDEPELAEALESIQDVSSRLGGMRPELGEAQPAAVSPPRKPTSTRRPLIGFLASGAVAAGLLLAFAFGPMQTGPDRPIDMHSKLAAEEISIDGGLVETVALGGSVDLPDLSGANLTPVALLEFNQGTVAHYAGRNGCRLSYFRVPGQLGTPNPDEGQSATWTAPDGFRHGIIATGMDAEKFAAISAYLQIATGQQAVTQVYAALESATADATPCAG